jgi:hypothetical protein
LSSLPLARRREAKTSHFQDSACHTLLPPNDDLVVVTQRLPTIVLILAIDVCGVVQACGLRGTARPAKGDVLQSHPPTVPAAGLTVSGPPMPLPAASPSVSWLLPSPTSHVPSAPPAALEADAALLLPIPARKQDPGSPRAGWCAETAIQEALLYAGAWTSQRTINRAGQPAHQDLHASDIPAALMGLGLRFTFFSPRKRGFDPFAAWVEEALRAGDPVLAGVKILPTEHPTWALDHFVLVVGSGSKGLLVNTTWGNRAWVGEASTDGLSFRNVVYGIRLRGLGVPPHATPARLSAIDEQTDTVKLRVTCEGLASGSSYRVERTRFPSDERPLWSEIGIAVGDRVEKEVAVDADGASRFYCIPIPGRPESQ